MLNDEEEGDSDRDERHQFCDLGPASLAPVAQADGEDNHRDGDEEQEQRGHAIESTTLCIDPHDAE